MKNQTIRTICFRLLTVLMLCLSAGLLCVACGKQNSKDLGAKVREQAAASKQTDSETLQNETEEPVTPESSAEVAEEESKHKTSDSVPELLLYRLSDFERDDTEAPVITQHYSYVRLDEASAAVHPALAKNLDAVRDALYSETGEKWDEHRAQREENDLLTFDERWDTYVRRADGDVISILTEYTGEGMFDTADDNRFVAHSYHTDDGSEIDFSEVVKDKEAFYDLLANKFSEQIRSQRYYGSLASMSDESKIKAYLSAYDDAGTCAFTIDPTGITCFINSYSDLSQLPISATVYFSQDREAKIFQKAFLQNASDRWAMQIPAGMYTFFEEEAGMENFVRPKLIMETLDNGIYEEYGIGGCIIEYGIDSSKWRVKEEGGTDYYDFSLMHTAGGYFLLASHPEFPRAYFEEFELKDDFISKIDNMRACPETVIDLEVDGYPVCYVPTNPTKIRILCPKDEDHDEPESEWVKSTVRIKDGGCFDLETVKTGDVGSGNVELTPEMQYRYNLFLSNFAEQADFSYTDYNVGDLCHFALEWKKINRPSKVKMDGSYYMITQPEINEILNGRINTNIEEGAFDESVKNSRHQGFVEGEYYKEPLADGEMYKNNRFAVVTAMREFEENGHFYACDFKVYGRDTELYDAEGITKAQYRLSEAQAAKDPSLYCKGQGHAVLRVFGLYGPEADCELTEYEMEGSD
ncbi:MAG: hypothetical protein K6E16_08900 [Lachnospiraceae bacterium]|nr:hypothetical protein [Lachnospiraceae bacterium]